MGSSPIQRAWLLIDAKQYEKAEEYARDAINNDPQDCWAWLCLAWVLRAQGRISDCVRCCHESLRHEANHAGAHNLLGWACYQLNDYRQAERAARKAIEIEPKNAEHYFLLSSAAYHAGRPKSALEHANEALRLEPEYSDALVSRGDALATLGRHNEAEVSYRQALAIAPEDQFAQLSLGWLNELRGQHRNAEKIYREVLENDASSTFARDKLFELRPSEALRYYGARGYLEQKFRPANLRPFVKRYRVQLTLGVATLPTVLALLFMQGWQLFLSGEVRYPPFIAMIALSHLASGVVAWVAFTRQADRWAAGDGRSPRVVDVVMPLVLAGAAFLGTFLLLEVHGNAAAVLGIAIVFLLLGAAVFFGLSNLQSARSSRWVVAALALLLLAPALLVSAAAMSNAGGATAMLASASGKPWLQLVALVPFVIIAGAIWDRLFT